MSTRLYERLANRGRLRVRALHVQPTPSRASNSAAATKPLMLAGATLGQAVPAGDAPTAAAAADPMHALDAHTDGVHGHERHCKVQLDAPERLSDSSAASADLPGASHPAGNSVHEQYRGMTKHPKFLRRWYSFCNITNALTCAIVWVRPASFRMLVMHECTNACV